MGLVCLIYVPVYIYIQDIYPQNYTNMQVKRQTWFIEYLGMQMLGLKMDFGPPRNFCCDELQ